MAFTPFGHSHSMRLVFFLLFLAVRLAAAELTLTIAPTWQGAPLAVPSAVVKNQNDQSLRLTRLAGIVSGVALGHADGSFVRLDGQYGFIDAESGRLALTLREVPEGDYAGIEFQLGLPPVVNHGSPDQWSAGHPLNPLVNGLHWNWSGGYVFLALEGRWRTPAGDERGFSYHLATDERVMTMRFRANFRVERATTISFALDVSRLLRDQKLAEGDGSETTHSGPNDTLAPQLAAAAERAWFWLEAKPTSSHELERVDDRLADAKNPLAHARGYQATPRAFTVPAGWPQPALPADNPLTVEGVSLGRKLFHDPQLSGNGAQSCASCHDPVRAFSDHVPFSRGAEGQPGVRNAQPLMNLAWAPAYAWDGSQPRIRDQTLAAMTNPIEMHADAAKIAARLAAQEHIRADFAAAFGTPDITPERIGLALEQFLLAQVSADSKFDRALRNEATLTDDEKRGFELFLTEYDPARGKLGADCFHCHGGPLFSDFAYKNNGLALRGSDRGREKVTASASDVGKFKTPSLRNVAVTAPYMHDGRFRTLEEVVSHYDHGVSRSATLDPNIAKHPADGLKLSADDQRALGAFLRTLTEQRFENALSQSRPPPRRPPPPRSLAGGGG
jgi:cytochrome c peroxidase